MQRPDALSVVRIGTLAGIVLLGIASCAQSDAVVARDGVDAAAPPPAPTFTPPPADGGDASPDAKTLLLCAATTCPAPFATCSTQSASSYRCDTDLSKSEQHCGACNHACPSFAPLGLQGLCVKGVCAFTCQSQPGEDRRNCNGVIDDGCEVDVVEDPKNCGACGNVCAAGEKCHDGVCGCPAPLIDCDGSCVNPVTDDANCGGCGTVCVDPAGACSPALPNSHYGCSAGVCGKLKCGYGAVDCNGDLDSGCASDGCEAHLNDNANCGGCGNKCGPGTECRDDGGGAGLKCLAICVGPACRCKANEVLCPSNGSCADLLNDPNNCGICLAACPRAKDSAIATCEKGVCVNRCVQGFADCNGDPTDGCEVDLSHDPTSCGTCGNRCDTGAGQPCIDGKCLMAECDAGVTK